MRSRLLIAHFVRRLLDNDLISPQADRHQVISVACAAVTSTGLFTAVLLSTKYLLQGVQSPAWTALVSLDDTFFFTSLSAIVMALIALAVWDALTLEQRDTAILAPLPIPARQLIATQLAAVLIFAAVFTVALNLIPSVVAPMLRVSELPVGFGSVVLLMAAHATATTLAGLFGFVAVLAVREVLRAAVGPGLFPRASPAVQGALVIALATLFLLLPVRYSGVSRHRLSPEASCCVPPLWFVGLHDVIAGGVLADLPATEPPADAPARLSILAAEARLSARYRRQRPELRRLARHGLSGLGIVTLIAAGAWIWNNRRLPPLPAPGAHRRHGLVTAATKVLQWTVLKHPLARAGFFFTLQTMSRSVPHRVTLAATLGAAIATAAVALHGTAAAADTAAAEQPLAAFAMQTLVLTVLLAGFRQASRVPAALRANATFLLAWSGNDRPFIEGVKRAGLLALGCPAVLAMVPLHLVLLGPRLALAHAACGAVVTFVLMELYFLGGRRLPLVSAYVPGGNLLGSAPIYLAVALTAVYAFASLERLALAERYAPAFLVLLALVGIALRLVRRGDAADGPVLAEEPAGGVVVRLSPYE